jgi:sulfate permease, SulP family
MHVRHSYRPHVGVLVHDDADHWRIEDPAPGMLTEPGLVMFWFGAGLFYANASFFAEQVRKLIEHPHSPIRWLVVDARAVTELDYSGGRTLAELHQDLSKGGIVLGMIIVRARHMDTFERTGLADLLGPDRIFESRYDCVQAYRSEISRSA